MIRLSIGNLVAVTALAVVGILAFKASMRMFPIRGLADVANGI